MDVGLNDDELDDINEKPITRLKVYKMFSIVVILKLKLNQILLNCKECRRAQKSHHWWPIKWFKQSCFVVKEQLWSSINCGPSNGPKFVA